jgi:WD40 repeat protein
MTTAPWFIAFCLAISPPAPTLAPVVLQESVLAKLGGNPHRIGATLLAVTPDSKKLITITPRGLLRIFDAQSGQKLTERTLFDYRSWNETRVLTMSRNGRVVAILETGENRKIILQDVHTGAILRTVSKETTREFNPYVWTATLSDDGKTLLVKDFDHNLNHYFISVETGEARKFAIFECDGTLSYEFSPNGKSLIVTRSLRGVDSIWQIFDVASAKPVSEEPFAFEHFHATFSHESETYLTHDSVLSTVYRQEVGSGRWVKFVELEESETGKRLIAGPKDFILFSPCYIPPDRFPVARIPASPILNVWNLASGKKVAALCVGEQTTELTRTGWPAAAFAPDGSFVVTNFEGNLCLWELPSGRRRFGTPTPPGPRGAVTHLAFSADGKNLLASGAFDSLGQWNCESQTWKPTRFVGDVRALGFSEHGGRAMAVSNLRGIPNLWDTDSGRLLATFNSRPSMGDRNSMTRTAAWNFDCSQALLSYTLSSRGDRATVVEVWDTTRTTRKSSMTIPNDYNPIAAFSPCGQLMVHRDTVIQVNGARHFDLVSYMSSRRSSSGSRFSPDGRLLFRSYLGSGTDDHCGEIWEVASGQLIATLNFNNAGVAFAPDGRTLAVATDLGVVLFDLVFQHVRHGYATTDFVTECLPNLPAHVPLAFSPDGTTLAAGNRDGTITLWKVPQPAATMEPTLAEYDPLWEQLANRDAAVARKALSRLLQHPTVGLAILKSKFQPPPPSADDPDLGKLILALDSPEFALRKAASDQLRAIGSAAKPKLQATLKTTESVEVRSRVEELLEQIQPVLRLAAPGEEARAARAMELLERIGNREAQNLLKLWAVQARDLTRTDAATAALARLARK